MQLFCVDRHHGDQGTFWPKCKTAESEICTSPSSPNDGKQMQDSSP